MALHTPRLAKKQKSSALLLSRHGVGVPSGEAINRSVGDYERELEFGDRFTEHEEINGCTGLHLGECFSKQLPVLRVRVEESQGVLSDLLIAAKAAPNVGSGTPWGHVPVKPAGSRCTTRAGTTTDRVNS